MLAREKRKGRECSTPTVLSISSVTGLPSRSTIAFDIQSSLPRKGTISKKPSSWRLVRSNTQAPP